MPTGIDPAAYLYRSTSPTSLKNNTPVNTEVLWGGGLWWGVTKDKRPNLRSVQVDPRCLCHRRRRSHHQRFPTLR